MLEAAHAQDGIYSQEQSQGRLRGASGTMWRGNSGSSNVRKNPLFPPPHWLLMTPPLTDGL
jgi:hypothetical protein